MVVSNILYVHPYLRKRSHFDQYFSNGLKPPTSIQFYLKIQCLTFGSLYFLAVFCKATKASRFGHVSSWHTSGIWPGFKWPTSGQYPTQKLTVFCGPWKIKSWKVKMSQLGMGYVTFREGTQGTVLELGHPLPWLSGVLSGQKHRFYVEWN